MFGDGVSLESELKFYKQDKTQSSNSILRTIKDAEDTLVELRELAKERAKDERIKEKVQIQKDKLKIKEEKIELEKMIRDNNIVLSFLEENSPKYTCFSDSSELIEKLKKTISVKGFDKIIIGNNALVLKFYSGNTHKIANIVKLNRNDQMRIVRKFDNSSDWMK